jgi:hypothetical protein
VALNLILGWSRLGFDGYAIFEAANSEARIGRAIFGPTHGFDGRMRYESADAVRLAMAADESQL